MIRAESRYFQRCYDKFSWMTVVPDSSRKDSWLKLLRFLSCKISMFFSPPSLLLVRLTSLHILVLCGTFWVHRFPWHDSDGVLTRAKQLEYRMCTPASGMVCSLTAGKEALGREIFLYSHSELVAKVGPSGRFPDREFVWLIYIIGHLETRTHCS